jgi:hypothetical protein
MERRKTFQTFDQSEYIFGHRFEVGGLELDFNEDEESPGAFALTHRDDAPETSAEEN